MLILFITGAIKNLLVLPTLMHPELLNNDITVQVSDTTGDAIKKQLPAT